MGKQIDFAAAVRSVVGAAPHLDEYERGILRGAALRVYNTAATPNEQTLAYLLARLLGAPAGYGEDGVPLLERESKSQE